MSADAEIAGILTGRFHSTACYFLQAQERGRELTANESRVVDFLVDQLMPTVDAVPAPLMKALAALAAHEPDWFDATLVALIRNVGSSFNPLNATEFVEKLNHFVLQRVRVLA